MRSGGPSARAGVTVALPHTARTSRPRLQALVLGRRLLMALASAGNGAEFEAPGAQQREAGAAHVIVDRVADVQLIDLVTRRDENYFDSTCFSKAIANVRLLLGGKIRLMVLGINGPKTVQAYRVESSIVIRSMKKRRRILTHVHSLCTMLAKPQQMNH